MARPEHAHIQLGAFATPWFTRKRRFSEILLVLFDRKSDEGEGYTGLKSLLRLKLL